MEIFQNHGLMFCSVQHIQEVLTVTQALENGYLTALQHPVQGAVAIPVYPVHFSVCNAGTRRAAPKLGEHTVEVLQQMGFSSSEIDSL